MQSHAFYQKLLNDYRLIIEYISLDIIHPNVLCVTRKKSNDIPIKNTPIKILIKHELNIIIHGTDKIKYRNHLRHDTRVYILTEH